MPVNEVEHLTLEERRKMGKLAREKTPRESLQRWEPAEKRGDPVQMLVAQDKTREPDLVPVRHGRMMVSPFTFYRGAAKIMAADLSGIPMAGLEVQLCGDAHLSNLGVFASPERMLLFDLNDFDETLRGPFEYDVARLASSFVVAARDNSFSAKQARQAAMAAVVAFREAMIQFSQMGTLEVWYSRLDAKALVEKGISAAKGGQEGVGTR